MYRIGDIVYLKTDPEVSKRIVTGILLRSNGEVYYLSKGDEPETSHFEFEFENFPNLI